MTRRRTTVIALILAVAAGVCLAVGWLLAQEVLVYVALGASGAGLVLVLGQAWLRRRKAAKDTVAEVPAAAELHDEEMVLVLPGESASMFPGAGCSTARPPRNSRSPRLRRSRSPRAVCAHPARPTNWCRTDADRCPATNSGSRNLAVQDLVARRSAGKGCDRLVSTENRPEQ